MWRQRQNRLKRLFSGLDMNYEKSPVDERFFKTPGFRRFFHAKQNFHFNKLISSVPHLKGEGKNTSPAGPGFYPDVSTVSV